MKTTPTSRRKFLASTGALGAALVLVPTQPKTLTLAHFHDGLDIPEHQTRIPWLITESELYEYIPHDAFAFSEAGWPMLRFTMLGINAVFGFNFVTHPDGRLMEIQYQNLDKQSIEHTFSVTSAQFQEHLPKPNIYDMEYRHLRWQDDCVFIDNAITEGFFALLKRNAQSHDLSVFYSAGLSMPDTVTTERDGD